MDKSKTRSYLKKTLRNSKISKFEKDNLIINALLELVHDPEDIYGVGVDRYIKSLNIEKQIQFVDSVFNCQELKNKNLKKKKRINKKRNTLENQDIIDIPWDGLLQPGQVEAAIANAGGTGTFRLEDGKVYLMVDHIPVPKDGFVKIIGSGSTDMHPATLQPIQNAEGIIGLTDGQMFNLVGDSGELHLENLILNCMSIDEGGNVGVASARSVSNKIVVDNCYISGFPFIAFSAMGTGTSFSITNSTFDGQTNAPGGMFYGGCVWGGGSWMGTIDDFKFQNNTVNGIVGEAFVLYEYVNPGSIIDHNTFINISMGVTYTYVANNLQITNNLYYNTRCYGQSTYDISNWGVIFPGGNGQLSARKKVLGSNETDSNGAVLDYYTMEDGQKVYTDNRNINYSNNVCVWSPALIEWMDNMAANPWSWTVNSSEGTESTVHDTMALTVDQLKLYDDSATLAIESNIGFTATNNVIIDANQLGSNIQEEYIIHMLARILDFRDDQITQGVGATHKWVYQHDDNHHVVEWPFHLDASYSTSSVAYTHAEDGLPVGDLNHFPDKKNEWSNSCMTGDTLIDTDNGPVEIQNLKNGDMILTNNGFKSLNMLIICGDHEPDTENPELNKFIEFPAGCLGQNVPSQNLYLTRWHPLVFGEKKVRAKDFVGKHPGVKWVSRKSKNYNLHFKDIQYYQIYGVGMESHILDPNYKPETYVTYDEVF